MEMEKNLSSNDSWYVIDNVGEVSSPNAYYRNIMGQKKQRKFNNLEAILIFSLSMVEAPFQWSPILSRL